MGTRTERPPDDGASRQGPRGDRAQVSLKLLLRAFLLLSLPRLGLDPPCLDLTPSAWALGSRVLLVYFSLGGRCCLCAGMGLALYKQNPCSLYSYVMSHVLSSPRLISSLLCSLTSSTLNFVALSCIISLYPSSSIQSLVNAIKTFVHFTIGHLVWPA